MAIYQTSSKEETEALGEKLAAELKGGMVVAFTGGLGAGKTAFCGGIAKGLGCTDPVQSPTFSIVNVYRGRLLFAHFDMYRISTEEDLYAASFYDYIDSGAVVAVEWSENIAAFLEEPYIKVEIAVTGENTRTITIKGAFI
ncbi:MAG: tRNA (adenosine(37)-N6)-threonylcarbamoyltransferase complex ATPase subunit type 1 TsaE [Pygmaiobacter sp.]